jgi:16S rRNA (adenine1518-N6/adenine1519-N6)-dimethyltransferase
VSTGVPPANRRRRPKRSLGQNFLVDPNIQRRIVDALSVGPDDEVLEIGPGEGALTRHLVGRVRRLVAVELDDTLVARLEALYGERADVEIIHGDILERPLATLTGDVPSLVVVGNIPYNITAPILFHLLERPRPREIVIMVQKEVADRIRAAPGSKEYGALTVGVGTVADVEVVASVPRGAFRPVPKVDSRVIRITPRSPPPLSEGRERVLRRLTRAAFGWRRKQFQKTLRNHPDLALAPAEVAAAERATGFDLTQRPERFSPEEFVELAGWLEERDRRASNGPRSPGV